MKSGGTKLIERLSQDLRHTFKGNTGFSARNLVYMRTFAESYPDEQFTQQLAAQIPWFHNCLVLDKIHVRQEREWYIRQTIENGWSRNVLALQIDSQLYQRHGKAITNFTTSLPEPQSDLAQQLTKDNYIFDFISLEDPIEEKKLERGLVENIRDFIIELGKGFAFIGNQVHIEVDRKDYLIDLLFYHYKLYCFVVVELKAGEFKPEYAGKMNFYLSAVDDLIRSPRDNPSIGIILCRSHSTFTVEYALRDMTKPMGVAQFTVTTKLPEKLENALPTAKELAAQLHQPVTKRPSRRKLPRQNDS